MSPRGSPGWRWGWCGGVGGLCACLGGCGAPGGSWGLLGAPSGRDARHVEEALVLLMGLLQHGRQSSNMVLHGPLPFLVGPLAFLGTLQLFTQDVHQRVHACPRLFMNTCAYMFVYMFMGTVFVFSTAFLRVHLSTVHCVHACPRMFPQCVHVRCYADKFRLVDHTIRGCAETPLVDELVQRSAGDAELASRFDFGELGHGQASACGIVTIPSGDDTPGEGRGTRVSFG